MRRPVRLGERTSKDEIDDSVSGFTSSLDLLQGESAEAADYSSSFTTKVVFLFW
jgi:hypothetical protein